MQFIVRKIIIPNASIENQIKVGASISLFESSVILEGADPADTLLVSGYIYNLK